MRICTICSHPERVAIDKAIVGGATLRDIARRYKISKDTVNRHKACARQLLAATHARRGRTLASEIERLRAVLDPILDGADEKLALAAVAQARGLLELEFGTRSKVDQTVREAPPADTVEELQELKRDVEAAIAEKERGLQ